jgi:hypothetical protein
MNKAYVDTTVLTDRLLKPGLKQEEAKKALAQFDTTVLPEYAFKELKAGPLEHYVYFYNKLLKTEDVGEALKSLGKLIDKYHDRKRSTALEAFDAAWQLIKAQTTEELGEEYEEGTLGEAAYEQLRLALKGLIMKAWKRRRKITSEVVLELPCYNETAPTESRNGRIRLPDKKCKGKARCCLASDLRQGPDEVEKLKDAISEDAPTNRENARRYKALREIKRKPKMDVDDKMCRSLGDAVFAFFAPDDAVILTTNVKDHRVLANALGKDAISPGELQQAEEV